MIYLIGNDNESLMKPTTSKNDHSDEFCEKIKFRKKSNFIPGLAPMNKNSGTFWYFFIYLFLFFKLLFK